MTSDTLFRRDFPFAEIRKTLNSTEIYKPHAHDKLFSVGAVSDGEAVMKTPTGDHTVGAGMLTFFNPMEVHSCNPSAGSSRSYCIMHLDVSWCTSLQIEAGITEKEFIPVEKTVSSDRELYEQFIEICESEHLDEEKLKALISEIFERYCEFSTAKELPAILMEEVERHIRDHIFEILTLEEISEKFRQNRFHLLRSFKKIYGQPPIAYQMNLRVETAKKLLKEGMSIADVAQQTGFQDQSHFHRVFKKLTTVTPGKYQSSN